MVETRRGTIAKCIPLLVNLLRVSILARGETQSVPEPNHSGTNVYRNNFFERLRLTRVSPASMGAATKLALLNELDGAPSSAPPFEWSTTLGVKSHRTHAKQGRFHDCWHDCSIPHSTIVAGEAGLPVKGRRERRVFPTMTLLAVASSL